MVTTYLKEIQSSLGITPDTNPVPRGQVLCLFDSSTILAYLVMQSFALENSLIFPLKLPRIPLITVLPINH